MPELQDIDLFPIRLRVARQISGCSMDDLVRIMGNVVSKQSLSLYEKGKRRPKPEVLGALSRALHISEEYLVGKGVSLGCASLRSCVNEDSASEEDWLRLEAEISFLLEQSLEADVKTERIATFVNPLGGGYITSRDDASVAADTLRSVWNCGTGPLHDILRLFERKGIKIFMCELPDDVLGLNVVANGNTPVIVLDNHTDKTTVERLRFTAAHELAHLILSFPPSLSPKEVESLCDNFAFCLLFPTSTFFEELGPARREFLALDELIDLKNTYGVSVSSLVYNAHKLGLISDEHYNDWFDSKIKNNIREMGWGGYPYKETIGRKLRIDAILAESNITNI